MVGLVITLIIAVASIAISFVLSLFLASAVYRLLVQKTKETYGKIDEIGESLSGLVAERFDKIGSFLIAQIPGGPEAAYSFVIQNIETKEEKLMLVYATDESLAKAKILSMLELQGINPDEWTTRGSTHLAPRKTDEPVKLEVKREITPIEPVQIKERNMKEYINYLKYAADNFATTPSEKKVIHGLVKRIEDGRT